jgi:hypothetical protein
MRLLFYCLVTGIKNKNEYLGDMKQTFLFFAALFYVISCPQNLAAQQVTTVYKWFDPATAASPVIEGRGWQEGLAASYDRLPQKMEKLVRLPLWNLSHNTAGEYIDFKTTATTIIVKYKVTGNHAMPHMPATGVSGVDLYAKGANGSWQWARGNYHFGDTIEYRFTNLVPPGKEAIFRLYLPLYNTITWMNIGVPADAMFAAIPAGTEKPIVVYGTSIMQGACASRPGLAWPSILGRKINKRVINLGFSGNGQLETPLIDLINEIDAQVFVLDCMPNLTNRTRFPKEEVQRRIVAAVKGIRLQHGSTPILLVAHSGGLPGADMDSTMTNEYKNTSLILSETFHNMVKEGVPHIYLLTDAAIGFGPESTVDGTHPNDMGMIQYAVAYEKIIREIITTKQHKAN